MPLDYGNKALKNVVLLCNLKKMLVSRRHNIFCDVFLFLCQELKALVSLDKPESLRTSHALAWTEVLVLFYSVHKVLSCECGSNTSKTCLFPFHEALI